MLYLIIGTYLFIVAGFLRENRFFDFNCALVLAFLAANHYNGFDWISYYHLYENETLAGLLSTESILDSTSPGFLLVLALAKLLGSYNIVFVTSSFAFVYCARRLAAHHPNRNIVLFMCFCFFAYYYYVERVKQGFSISLLMLSISQMLRARRGAAWLSMFAAMLFHTSAILAIPLLTLPYKEETSNRNERLIGTVIIISLSVMSYFLLRSPLTGFFSGIFGYYLSSYATQIVHGFNPGFFVSIGGLSFLCMLFVIYRVSLTAPPSKQRNYAYFIYLFSYVTSSFYGFIRISNYYYPYVIHVLADFAGKKRTNNMWRLMILVGALVQLIRPLSTPYYFDSIMRYQLWGISGQTPSDMQHTRCNSVLSSDAYNELAIYSCAKKL